jgi:hypothetical protein
VRIETKSLSGKENSNFVLHAGLWTNYTVQMELKMCGIGRSLNQLYLE